MVHAMWGPFVVPLSVDQKHTCHNRPATMSGHIPLVLRVAFHCGYHCVKIENQCEFCTFPFQDEIDPALLAMLQQQQARKERKPKKLTPEQADAKRRKLWTSIAKKEIPKVALPPLSYDFVSLFWSFTLVSLRFKEWMWFSLLHRFLYTMFQIWKCYSACDQLWQEHVEKFLKERLDIYVHASLCFVYFNSVTGTETESISKEGDAELTEKGNTFLYCFALLSVCLV